MLLGHLRSASLEQMQDQNSVVVNMIINMLMTMYYSRQPGCFRDLLILNCGSILWLFWGSEEVEVQKMKRDLQRWVWRGCSLPASLGIPGLNLSLYSWSQLEINCRSKTIEEGENDWSRPGFSDIAASHCACYPTFAACNSEKPDQVSCMQKPLGR